MGCGADGGAVEWEGHKSATRDPPLNVDPNSRAPVGPGPSPLCPLSAPSSVLHCLGHPPAPNFARLETPFHSCLEALNDARLQTQSHQ